MQQQFHLRVGQFYRILGLVSFLLGLGIALWMIFDDENDANWLPLMPVLILMIPGLFLWMWSFFHQLIFDDERVRIVNWRGISKEIIWSDLTKISFNQTMGFLTLHTTHQTFKIYVHLIGFDQFLAFLDKHCSHLADKIKS